MPAWTPPCFLIEPKCTGTSQVALGKIKQRTKQESKTSPILCTTTKATYICDEPLSSTKLLNGASIKLRGTFLNILKEVKTHLHLKRYTKQWNKSTALQEGGCGVRGCAKNAPPPDINGTNLLTKFHDDRTINMASIVLRKNATPPWWSCFSTNLNHFRTHSRYHCTNFVTKFHDDRTINVASIVLISHIKKNAPPPSGHVFKATETIFELKISLFHENQIINVASRVLTRKNAPPPGGHIF
ncbi:hypothetical protein DPMN_051987 [Dreissena polymorpha]|uniref:Uncharacterized protein n=1 Tax=Dreissena polymorpha TaxID=45954 RepID=A0A9D4HPE6_DREPO|nr:hypothetical protein DPMN_051987 [Dreissena polymorpha]